MSTFNTGNPVPSTDVRDLYDNAQNFDTAVNTRASRTWLDRLGVARKSWYGLERDFADFVAASSSTFAQFLATSQSTFDLFMDTSQSTFDLFMDTSEDRFNNFLISSGFTVIGDYAAGLEITEYTQLVRRDGEFYRISPSVDLPYTLTGVWLDEESLFIPVGDAELRQQLAADNGATLVGYTPAGTGNAFRSVQARLRDVNSALDKLGVVGDGVTDSTAGIDAALAMGNVFFPEGTYLYAGDFDALMAKAYGPGVIRYQGLDYKASRNTVRNILWPGELAAWPMGPSVTLSSVERTMMPARVTHAMLGLQTGTLVEHVVGSQKGDAIRIRKIATFAETRTHTMVLALSPHESVALRGKDCVFSFNGFVGASYSGADVTVRAQCSNAIEQVIDSPGGEYWDDHVSVAEQTFTMGTEARPQKAPFYFRATFPELMNQASLVFSVPFGVGDVDDAEDFIELQSIRANVGDHPEDFEQVSQETAEWMALEAYFSSFPKHVGPGGATEQGSVSATAVTVSLQNAFEINVRFPRKMSYPPRFKFKSHVSGVTSRLYNARTGTFTNGIPYNLSDAGVTITNNGVVEVGDRCSCHYWAECPY